MIVQASPHVVSAGDIAEDFAIFPVVQEQVLVGLRPAPPSEAARPQGAAATGGYVAAGAPLLAVSSLRGFDGVDDITAKFLLQQALVLKEKEEEERVKREQEQLQRQEDQEEARLTRLEAERDALLVLGLETLSSQQKKRLNAVLDEREVILDRWERRRVEKRRKKKKKKKLPKVSSHSSCGRARRRQRQWLGCIAGFSGVFMAVSVFCARLGSHWIHAFWYVAMCMSTAPVTELAVMSFTVPLTGYTSDATATVVASFSRRQIPCCGGVCVAMSCGGGFFSPGSASDSIWDSVKPMTGNYFFNYFQYYQFVGCTCMLNYWFSSYDEFCPANYNYSWFKLMDKCRSEKWELYLYGDLIIKVDSDSVDVLPRGVPPFRLFTQLGNGHTPSMVVPAF